LIKNEIKQNKNKVMYNIIIKVSVIYLLEILIYIIGLLIGIIIYLKLYIYRYENIETNNTITIIIKTDD